MKNTFQKNLNTAGKFLSLVFGFVLLGFSFLAASALFGSTSFQESLHISPDRDLLQKSPEHFYVPGFIFLLLGVFLVIKTLYPKNKLTK